MLPPQAELKKTSPRDFFLYLLSIVALYIVAWGFGALLFQYTNILFPDPLERNLYQRKSGSFQIIRWAMASLIIVYPLYIWSSWFLEKQYLKFPWKRDARVRKWLIYFTLSAAAVVMVADVVTLLYRLLGGELTGRFLLKVAAVLFVSGVIFGYYFWEMRRSHDGLGQNI